MATTGFLTRSILTATKRNLTSAHPPPLPTNFPLISLRSVSFATFRRLRRVHSTVFRAFSTRRTSSSLNDQNPNWSNRPPKETILLDGCDFEHWLVVMEKPEGDPSRDEIIDSYIKTLATVVGSEEEARMKIYSVSTRHYYAFGALVPEELSYKLKELPKVRWVLPDSYLDVKNKDYGGEPFINGQAVPYDPKYHEIWVRNNNQTKLRNNRSDRPRSFDRSRNYDRRREMQMSDQRPQAMNSNMAGGSPGNLGTPNHGLNMAGGPPSNMDSPIPGGSPRGMEAPQPNVGGAPNMGGMPPNMDGVPPDYRGGVPPHNMERVPPGNMGCVLNNVPNFQGYNGQSNGSVLYQSGQVPDQSSYAPNPAGVNPYQNTNMPYQSGPVPNQSNYGPNPAIGNPYQNQNAPERDMPPPPKYH